MITWETFLQQHIKKLHAPLKEESELIMILKRRLTKKEFKICEGLVLGVDEVQLQEKLLLDAKRYDEVKTKALKKINFHDFKEELLAKEA